MTVTKDKMTEYYNHAEQVTKEIYKFETVKVNKQELLSKSEFAKEVYNYMMSIIPDVSNTILLQNINWDSILYNYIMQNGYSLATYHDILGTICKGIISPYVSDHTSKLNRNGAVNSVLYLFIIA